MASTNEAAENGFKKPRALGSKSRSFIPMTPRSLKTNSEHRNDFARQVAEQSHPRGQDGQPPQKKFRSNAAPKGTRLASGYVDRAQERQKEQDDGEEDKQRRLKALEEMLKLQQIDQATFEKLRDEIGIGGDTSSTHLVKGLDFKLLERIRRGDNVEKAPESEPEPVEEAPEADVEDELEKALERDVTTTDQPKTTEADDSVVEQASETNVAQQDAPLTRNEILQRIKQARKKQDGLASPEPTQPVESQAKLDQSRFRKLETKPKTGKHKFTETINGRRREVLVITGKDGKTKRKTRWLDPEPDPTTIKKGEENNQAWGGDLPAEVLARQKLATEEEAARQKAMEEEDDGDIFGGVADYDPLAGLDSDEEDKPSRDSEARNEAVAEKATATDDVVEEDTSSTTTKPLKSTSKPRNYFSTTESTDHDTEDPSTKGPTHDPAILAALKRAAQIRQQEDAEVHKTSNEDSSNDNSGQTPEGQARNKALLEKLQNQSGYGDDVDVDMGFGGGSRYDDEDEEGEGKQKLSQWKGIRAEGENEEDEGDDTDKKGGAKRKRGGGGKKRKGDKNSFKDVMSVIEGRKKT